MDRAQFYKEVYSITKEIPYGNVFTYGKIAQLIGNPQYSRMVGQALSFATKVAIIGEIWKSRAKLLRNRLFKKIASATE